MKKSILILQIIGLVLLCACTKPKIQPEEKAKERAKIWATDTAYDAATRKKVKEWLNNYPDSINEAFGKIITFGTSGLREKMGIGTNRMNQYTVAIATQGFANYLNQQYPNDTIKVVISYDCRDNSTEFAEKTAQVFAANGFIVYLFKEMRPVPELSFAVRHLKCHAGIMITASHNPPKDNGYKAYWKDGGQLVPPNDKNVTKEVEKITSFKQVKQSGGKPIFYIGEDIDSVYLNYIKTLSFNKSKEQNKLKIVYTSLHGAGKNIVPKALKEFGFNNVEKIENSGKFSDLATPNPEEKGVMNTAISLAIKNSADIVLATDPDADRVGVAVRNKNGEYEQLTGNETAALLTDYLIRKWKETGKITGKEYVAKSIVTTDIIKDIAEKNGVKCYEVLTGFKYIAEMIEKKQKEEHFIFGGEESLGYLIGDFVRDKDGVSACCIISEMAQEAAIRGESLLDVLQHLYETHGYYKEDVMSIVIEDNKDGRAKIDTIMTGYRKNPPVKLDNSQVSEVRDYSQGYENLPAENVLQFFTEDGSKVTVRPSGTEPKIKFYFSVKTKSNADACDKLKNIKEEFELIKK